MGFSQRIDTILNCTEPNGIFPLTARTLQRQADVVAVVAVLCTVCSSLGQQIMHAVRCQNHSGIGWFCRLVTAGTYVSDRLESSRGSVLSFLFVCSFRDE